MAIQAVGAIAGASTSIFALSRNSRAAGPVGAIGPGPRPVTAVPLVVGREDSSRESQADSALTAAGSAASGSLPGLVPGRSAGVPPLDRRGPEAILSRAAPGRDIAQPGGGKDAAAKDAAAKESAAKEATAKDAAAKRGGTDKAAPGELERRLADLEAEKARGEKRRADLQGERSLETARILSQLRARDAHVRGHEAAHIGAGGAYVRGGASFSYQKGPDGRQYAVGGEVGIDSSPIAGKPAETAAKARIIRAAALAPSDPSAADLAIAGAASEMEAAALAELAAMRADAAAKGYGAEQAKSGGTAAFPGQAATRAAAATGPAGSVAALGSDYPSEPGIDLVA